VKYDSPEAIAAVHFGAEAQDQRERRIFNGAGALQSDGDIWRLGVDYATVLHTGAQRRLHALHRS